MGTVKTFVKEATVNRIKVLLKKYKTIEGVKDSKEFQSLYNNFMNGFEKMHVEDILYHCDNDMSYDEIRYLIEGESSMSKTNKKNKNVQQPKENTKKKNIEQITEREFVDEVEEAMYMVSEQRVREVGPVDVIIGDDETETQNIDKNKNRNDADNAVDVDFTEVSASEENETPVLLKNIVENAATDSKKKDKNNTSKKEESEDVGELLFSALSDFAEDLSKGITDAIRETDEYCEKIKRENDELRKKIRAELLAQMEEDKKAVATA